MTKETWIPAGAAAKILEERFGRPIRVDYVTRLGTLGRLRKQNIGSRIVLYHRHDVEQIQIRERKKPSVADRPTQIELPIAHQIDEIVPVEEKPIPAISQPVLSQISNVARFEELPTGQPSGTMKRADFVKDYDIPNDRFGTWLKDGLGDDRLEATYYLATTKKKSACFTPEQIAHNIEVLKRHGKLKS